MGKISLRGIKGLYIIEAKCVCVGKGIDKTLLCYIQPLVWNTMKGAEHQGYKWEVLWTDRSIDI